MKNRARQRANRKIKEEMLDLRDMCGIKDPTPYEAVKEIIRELKQNNESLLIKSQVLFQKIQWRKWRHNKETVLKGGHA